eukprot:gene3402-3881_t
MATKCQDHKPPREQPVLSVPRIRRQAASTDPVPKDCPQPRQPGGPFLHGAATIAARPKPSMGDRGDARPGWTCGLGPCVPHLTAMNIFAASSNAHDVGNMMLMNQAPASWSRLAVACPQPSAPN